MNCLNEKRVLISEDQTLTALLLRHILTREGMDVIGVAADGVEEIEIALREEPDIIISDIQMPRMNGLTAARHILCQYAPCIVFVTSANESDYRSQASELGAAGYILKPYHPDDLVRRLKAIVERWQPKLIRQFN